jgi:hypothetical protein
MPNGPQGQNRPADAMGCAVIVAELATSELTETLQKPAGRVNSGKAGAMVRTSSLSTIERVAISHKAAIARWGK